MEKKISVIIPVYNVEKYLAECLASVTGQTLREIEIICVNDGSLDRSREILVEYAEQDVRICILDKPNGGLSSARNMGLKAAQGRYILFLDSDDFLKSEDVLYTLYQKAETEELEQLFFDAEVLFESEEIRKNNLNYINYYKRKNNYTETVSGKELFCKLQSNWDFKPNVCMQLFSREFLHNKSLQFCENILHEDEVFTIECATFSRRAAYINKIGLIRRIRGNSIMTTPQKAGSIYGYYYGIEKLIDFAQEYVSYEDRPFVDFYLQRINVMMELAALLYAKEDEINQNYIISGVKKENVFRFAADMQAWKKLISLKERQQRFNTEKAQQREELAAAERKIQALSAQLDCERNETVKVREALEEELEEEKKKIEQIKQSVSYKVGKAATWVPRKAKKIIRGKAKRKVYLIGTPEFGNLGDHMISETELEMLRSLYAAEDICEITMDQYWRIKDKLKSMISESDLLFFQGGGNIGNLWLKSEYIRRDAFSIWKRQKKIIFPQSIYFSDDEEGKKEFLETYKAYNCPRLLLCCRDEASFRFAQNKLPCDSIYVPDTVLFHKPRSNEDVKREGAILCLRNDNESTLSDQDRERIKQIVSAKYSKIIELDTVGEKLIKETRQAGLKKFFEKLRTSEIVVTDRMHGMIFCALEGIPCIALDNSYHKISGAYKWLEPLDYIHYIKKIDEIKKWLDQPSGPKNIFPYESYREKFLPLLQIVK